MNKVFSLLLSCPHDDKYWQRLSATSRCCKPEYAGYLIIPWMFQKCMRNIWLYLLHFVNNWSIWLWRCILHLTFQKNLHSVMPYINVLEALSRGKKDIYFELCAGKLVLRSKNYFCMQLLVLWHLYVSLYIYIKPF